MRSFRIFILMVFGALVTLAPVRAYAHLVNTEVGEFYAGMMHPVTSLEHLLPTLALGLLAGQCGKRAARWALVIFPVALIVGILGGRFFGPLGIFRFANLAALILLGGMLAASDRMSTASIAAVAIFAGLILGYRSGVDMAAAVVGFQFVPGVALTGFIFLAILAGWAPQAESHEARVLRAICGLAFVATGMVMVWNAYVATDLQSIRSVGVPGGEDLVSLLKSREMSLPIVGAALMGALLWGAAHALTPGHGKAIVGAYLVGARSTPLHAVYLGLTVTVTHTLGVFALGLIALFASRYIVPEQLYPWLGALSGLIVLILGITLLWVRLKPVMTGIGHKHSHHHEHEGSHNHGHSHLPPDLADSPVTWRSLLALGVSGGLLPCPAALVLLLTAISLGRIGLGITLVVAFSLGLAGVLVTVGLLFVKGSRLVQKTPQFDKLSRYAPAASACVIIIIGVTITIGSVYRLIS